jgi:glycosyltransferase involved in cell wall biosynthesis
VTKDFQEEIIEGIKYVWLKGNAYDGSFSRIRNILSFVWKLQRNAKKIAKTYHPDLVIASSTYTLDNIPAFKIAKQAGAKYTYEIHDLWPLSPMLIGGYSKSHPFIMMMQWGENYAYKHVDKVVSLLWNAEVHCREHGLTTGKFVCVPNGYNPEEWTEDSYNLPLPDEHKSTFENLKDKTIVGFAGGFAASGALITVLGAAEILNNRNDIHFVLVGKGPEEQQLKDFVAYRNLSNVTFLPSVAKHLIPSLVHCFDVAYYGGIHSELHKFGTSANKMTDYMLSSKPIVQSLDEPGSLIERIGAGIRVPAENSQEVATAISSLVSLGKDKMREMGEVGKQYAINYLKWEKLAADFINAFI